jgi:predicted MFS family arabinose efflux permease
MRGFFAMSAALTLWGVLWRRVRLKESTAVTPNADLGELLQDMVQVAKHLWAQPGLKEVLGSFLLVNALANLNKAYYALYVTGPLRLSEGAVGWLSTAGALAFVVGSLGWVPRLKPGEGARLFFGASLLSVLPILALAFTHDLRVILLLALLGGGVASVHGALMSERVAGLLPAGREGLGQSLLSSLMQVAVALSLFLGGALFETRFSSFPFVLGALALGQAALAWALWKKAPPQGA